MIDNVVWKRAIEYVRNTGGNCTVEIFDDDNSPIGFQLRRDIMPKYVVEQPNGKLTLTDAGREAIL